MQEQMNPVGWFEIYVNDLERAKNFYEAVFGYELTELSVSDEPVQMLAFPIVQGGNASGAIVKMDGISGGGNSTIVYFSCDDCGEIEKLVAPNGGDIMKSKFSIGEHGFCSLVFDSEKNIIGLHSMK